MRAALHTTVSIILNVTTAKEGDSTESHVNNFFRFTFLFVCPETVTLLYGIAFVFLAREKSGNL